MSDTNTILSVWDANFIVIDVETTGGNPSLNRIMDIACVTTNSGMAVEKFESLINPHQFIPIYIQKMTRISNEMVYSAPDAWEVLPIVQNILNKDNAVFVAHNVNFDYKFVKEAFKQNDILFPKIEKLCTVKLSRRLLKKEMKKNVGALADYFGIKISQRHRAMGDADATSKILCELLSIAEDEHSIQSLEELLDFQNKKIKNFVPQSATQKRLQEKIDALPNSPGVYYFLNKDNAVHYVGKAKNLRERVMSYFTFGNVTSRKISTMLRKTYSLDWECTDSELSALIYESRQIKELLPYYNTMEKTLHKYPFIRLTVGEDFPRVELVHEIEDDGAEYFGPFRTQYLAETLLENVVKNLKLRKCDDDIKPNAERRPCFYYHLDKCAAPCACLINAVDYKEFIKQAHYYLSAYDNGIIKQLEEKMYEFSDNLEFEKAAVIKQQIDELRKVFDKQSDTPVSVNSDNFAMIIELDKRDKIVQILLVRSGKLAKEYSIGRKAPLDEINDDIAQLYYSENNKVQISDYNSLDVNDLKIINSWTFRNKDKAEFVYFSEIDYASAIHKMKEKVRGAFHEVDEDSPFFE